MSSIYEVEVGAIHFQSYLASLLFFYASLQRAREDNKVLLCPLRNAERRKSGKMEKRRKSGGKAIAELPHAYHQHSNIYFQYKTNRQQP